MTIPAQAPGFPGPCLQPDPKRECSFYAAAYVARCLGRPEVTAGQVQAWRAETSRHESYFATCVLGADTRRFWDVYGDGPKRKMFWLGPGARDWVRSWLDAGWLAQVMVHRVPEMGHAVVLLSADDDGVLLMDPIHGHVREPWEWFLGPGARREDEPPEPPGSRTCHHIEAWYRPAAPGCEALDAARHEFVSLSAQVWREIDRLDAQPEGYHPDRMSVELRKKERAAWERWRDISNGEGGLA